MFFYFLFKTKALPGSFIFRKKHFIFLTCIYFYFKTWEKKEAPDSSPKAQRPAWLLTPKQEQKLKWSVSVFFVKN